MKNIKILDCTFRDGGYINNWDFSESKTQEIINIFSDAGIEYIELGYIQKNKKTNQLTIFSNFNDIKNFIPHQKIKSTLCAMITYGKFPIEEIPNVQDSCIKTLRLIFKKHQKFEALTFAKQLLNKGYRLFINPTAIHLYSNEELKNLILDINKLAPFAYTIMDSFGVLNEKELIDKYKIIDKFLNKEISICFHSHNNLNLSFANATTLIKECDNREIIIDSSLMGMGRGAGNLCIEDITTYLNQTLNKSYNTQLLKNLINKEIKPIYNQTPWGYATPYYLSAKNYCHPNYAKFLIDKKFSKFEEINSALQQIEPENRAVFNKNIIELIVAKLKNS